MLGGVLLVPGWQQAVGDCGELAHVDGPAPEGPQGGPELVRIAGSRPAHRDAVLDKHLPEDRLGVAQGRAVAQASDLGRGGSLQIPGQETARQVDAREAGSREREADGEQGQFRVPAATRSSFVSRFTLIEPDDVAGKALLTTISDPAVGQSTSVRMPESGTG